DHHRLLMDPASHRGLHREGARVSSQLQAPAAHFGSQRPCVLDGESALGPLSLRASTEPFDALPLALRHRRLCGERCILGQLRRLCRLRIRHRTLLVPVVVPLCQAHICPDPVPGGELPDRAPSDAHELHLES
ncbi:ABCA1, partial [Symbiodinium sp. CCMP2456]